MLELKFRELGEEEKEIADAKFKRIVEQALKALVRFIDTEDRTAFRAVRDQIDAFEKEYCIDTRNRTAYKAVGDQIDAFKDEYCEEEGVN